MEHLSHLATKSRKENLHNVEYVTKITTNGETLRISKETVVFCLKTLLRDLSKSRTMKSRY
jgi:DNA-dependent RNA polymerase auxiliary subunit epsilon